LNVNASLSTCSIKDKPRNSQNNLVEEVGDFNEDIHPIRYGQVSIITGEGIQDKLKKDSRARSKESRLDRKNEVPMAKETKMTTEEGKKQEPVKNNFF